jgi:AcrR family transcriptional regulator
MAASRQPVETKRRTPRQTRAAETVAAILEAAAQILEKGGLAAFTTNAVAERAGVSIGTLYQYFADKNALLRALGEREMAAALANIGTALSGQSHSDAPVEDRVRAVVRALINAFGGRQRARKAVVQAVMAQGNTIELLAPVAAFMAQAEARQSERGLARLNREQAFVLSRALMGAIRAGVLEEVPFFKGRAFEDELVRLILSYLTAISGPMTGKPSF